MSQRPAQRGFGFLPPLNGALNETLDGVKARIGDAASYGEAQVAALRRETGRLSRGVQSELEARGLAPPGRRPGAPPANAPKKSQGSTPSARPGGVAAYRATSPTAAKPNTPTPMVRATASAILDTAGKLGKEAGGQLRAGINGATDAATFGLGDRFQAADFALRTVGMGGTIEDRYNAFRRLQMAQDEYDAEHRPIARNIGGFIGAVAPMVVTGGTAAAPMAVARVAANAPRAATGAAKIMGLVAPRAAVAAGGAGVSAASQIESDIVANRPISGANVAGSMAGGAFGALTGVRNAPVGAAVSSVVTDLSRPLLGGEQKPLHDMALDAGLGAALALSGHKVGRDWSNNLPSSKYSKRGRWISKEELGERLGEFHSSLRGEITSGRQVRTPVRGGHTRVDQTTESWFEPTLEKLNEFKFGYRAGLTKRQREAKEQYSDRFRHDWFLPDDIGNALGNVFGLTAVQMSGEDS